MQGCLHVAKYTHLTRTATRTVMLSCELELLLLAGNQRNDREYYLRECHT